MRTVLTSVAGAAVLLLASTAQAQSFPAEADWVPFECGDSPAFDATDDVAAAPDERDIVGDSDDPAGFRAVDDDYLYLRMRIDKDPTSGTAFSPYGWGFLLDTDQDDETYEVQMLLDGVDATVYLYQNTASTPRNDTADPPDDPEVASYELTDNAQSLVLGSDFGGDEDFSIDIAIPWDDLEGLGVTPTTEVAYWLVTGTDGVVLDGDIACHGGAGGLDDGASDRTVSDTDADSDGDGYSDAEEIDEGSDPNDSNDTPAPADVKLEGGGGCAMSDTKGGSWAWLFALLALVMGKRNLSIKRGARRRFR